MLLKPKTFIHPSGNGHQETIDVVSFIALYLFGPLYLILKRAWGAALIYVLVVPAIHIALFIAVGLFVGSLANTRVDGGVLLLAAGPLAHVFVTMVALDAVEGSYLRRGWRVAQS